MIDKVLDFTSQIVKHQGFTVVVLTAFVVWSQYNYSKMEEKIDKIYSEDRRELMQVVQDATEVMDDLRIELKNLKSQRQ